MPSFSIVFCLKCVLFLLFFAQQFFFGMYFAETLRFSPLYFAQNCFFFYCFLPKMPSFSIVFYPKCILFLLFFAQQVFFGMYFAETFTLFSIVFCIRQSWVCCSPHANAESNFNLNLMGTSFGSGSVEKRGQQYKLCSAGSMSFRCSTYLFSGLRLQPPTTKDLGLRFFLRQLEDVQSQEMRWLWFSLHVACGGS